MALGSFPTPLELAPRLSAALGGPPIFIKREDLSGLALGGNKTRQAEALMAEAMEAGADSVVATAAAQSNFCRTIAAAGAKLGLHVHLLLRAHGNPPVNGNLLLDELLGAEIEFIDTLDAYDPIIAPRTRSAHAASEGSWPSSASFAYERRGCCARRRSLHSDGSRTEHAV